MLYFKQVEDFKEFDDKNDGILNNSLRNNNNRHYI